MIGPDGQVRSSLLAVCYDGLRNRLNVEYFLFPGGLHNYRPHPQQQARALLYQREPRTCKGAAPRIAGLLYQLLFGQRIGHQCISRPGSQPAMPSGGDDHILSAVFAHIGDRSCLAPSRETRTPQLSAGFLIKGP